MRYVTIFDSEGYSIGDDDDHNEDDNALYGDGESPLVIYQSSMLACHESLASLSSLCLCVNDDVCDHDDDHDLTILVIMIIITQS